MLAKRNIMPEEVRNAKLLLSKGLSDAEVASIIGRSVSAVVNIRNGAYDFMLEDTPRKLKKLAMPVGVSRSTPLPWRTLASCCLTQSYLLSVSISSCKSLWKMAALNWCLPRW